MVTRGQIDNRQASAIARQFMEHQERRQIQEIQATANVILPEQQWQRYEFLQQISAQGPKRLYKAYDRELQRIVALKLLASSDAVSKERLRTRSAIYGQAQLSLYRQSP